MRYFDWPVGAFDKHTGQEVDFAAAAAAAAVAAGSDVVAVGGGEAVPA